MELPPPRQLSRGSYQYVLGYFSGALIPAIAAWAAGVVSPPGAIVVSFAVASLFVWRYLYGYQLTLRQHKAEPISIAQAPELHVELLKLVEKTSQRIPEVWQIAGPGAAAISHPGGGLILLGRELVAPFWSLEEPDSFWRDRLQAALAHELGHLQWRDALIGCAVGTGWIVMHGLLLTGLLAMQLIVASLAVAIGSAILLCVVQIAIQRAMEHRSDSYALALTNNPQALNGLLVELEYASMRAERHRGWALPNLGHPPLRERLNRIISRVSD